MTRDTFMKQLEQLLATLPSEERRDALDYYDEYFDAAGPEKEAETIAELGSPEEVARKILEDQPQVPSFTDANRQNAPLPPEPPRRERPHTNYTLRWIGLAIVVLILCAYLIQHSSAREATYTVESASVVTPKSESSQHVGTRTEATETDAAPASGKMELTGEYNTVAVPLSQLKKLTLDIDAGAVVFEQESGITEATITCTHKADSAKLTSDFNDHGTTISYKLANNVVPSKNSNFTITITLPADFEMDELEADFDMASLTLGDLKVKKLTADLDMGSVTAGALTCGTADIELDMGSFTADSVTAQKLTAESSMGSLTIDRLDCPDSDLSTDMGSITVALTGTERDYGIDADLDMGKLTIGGTVCKSSYHTSGSRSLKLSDSMGSVTVSFLN